MTGPELSLLALWIAGSVWAYRLGRADGRIEERSEENIRRLDVIIAKLKKGSVND